MKYEAQRHDVYLMGLGMVLGGVCVNWNLGKASRSLCLLAARTNPTPSYCVAVTGMRYGLSTFFMSWLFSATLYFLLVMCLAELTSVVAFAGGSYGYVRCGLSPLLGFIVGVSEWFQNNTHVIGSVIVIGRSVNNGFDGLKEHWRPMWYFLSYVLAIFLVARGGKVFWYSMTVSAAVTLVLIALFIFGALVGNPHFEETAKMRLDQEESGFMGNDNMILRVVNYSGWMFMGCEAVTVSIAKTANAKEIIPRSILAVYGTVLLVTMAVILLSYIERVDKFQKYFMNRYPFEYVFQRYYGLGKEYSAFLVLVPSFASALGFMFASMYQTHAMAMSGLLPAWLRKTEGDQRIPVRALLCCALVQYAALFASWRSRYDRTSRVFFTLSMTGASFAYCGIFATFIAFRRRFANLPRGFRSPLGEAGAAAGMFLSVVYFVCGVGFQEFSVLAVAYGFCVVAAVVWYKAVAERGQFFSPEEQQKFLRAYVVKLNTGKRPAKLQKGASAALPAHKRPQKRHVNFSSADSSSSSNQNASVSSNANDSASGETAGGIGGSADAAPAAVDAASAQAPPPATVQSPQAPQPSHSKPSTQPTPTPHDEAHSVHSAHSAHTSHLSSANSSDKSPLPPLRRRSWMQTSFRVLEDVEHVAMVLLGVRPLRAPAPPVACASGAAPVEPPVGAGGLHRSPMNYAAPAMAADADEALLPFDSAKYAAPPDEPASVTVAVTVSAKLPRAVPSRIDERDEESGHPDAAPAANAAAGSATLVAEDVEEPLERGEMTPEEALAHLEHDMWLLERREEHEQLMRAARRSPTAAGLSTTGGPPGGADDDTARVSAAAFDDIAALRSSPALGLDGDALASASSSEELSQDIEAALKVKAVREELLSERVLALPQHLRESLQALQTTTTSLLASALVSPLAATFRHSAASSRKSQSHVVVPVEGLLEP